MKEEVSMSDSAADRISYLMAKEKKPNCKLRISVEGGGCSGFQYKYEIIAEDASSSDLIVKNGEAVVLIDDMSLKFMKGATVDYIQNLGGEYFEIKNPNAANGCGCGNSFSV